MTLLHPSLQLFSCVQTIEDALLALSPPPLSIDVSIVSQSVTIRHDHDLTLSTINSSLKDAGFDIAETPAEHSSSGFRATENTFDLLLGQQSRHLAQCMSCQADIPHIAVESITSSHKSSFDTGQLPSRQAAPIEQGPYSLLLSVGGMTCAACSVTVTRLVSEIYGVLDVAVDLIGHSAKVVIENRKLSEIVVETIEDAGYDAQVVRLESVSGGTDHPSTGVRKISLRVDGMFCQ